MGEKLFFIEKLKTSDTFARVQEREREGEKERLVILEACGLIYILTVILQKRLLRPRDVQLLDKIPS